MDELQPTIVDPPPAEASPPPAPGVSRHLWETACKAFWHLVLEAVQTAFRAARTIPGAISIVVVAGLLYASGRVWPHYRDRYALQDAMVEVARAPIGTDQQLLNRLVAAVEERHMQRYVMPEDFQITTYEDHRRISCAYEAPVFFIPEQEERLSFRIEVEEPFLEASILDVLRSR